MRQRIHQEIFFYSCLAMVFFLGLFPRVVPAIILLMLANWLVGGSYLKRENFITGEKWRVRTISFASLYFLYAVGMLYSVDYGYGRFDLEVKSTLLIFPLIFSTSDLKIFTPGRIRLVSGSFIAGCFTGLLILLAHAYGLYCDGRPFAFYYTNLAWIFHTSYIAMYYAFCISILLGFACFAHHSLPLYVKVIIAVLLLFFEAMIFLLSSKAGILSLVLAQGIFIIWLIRKKKGFRGVILLTMAFVLVFLAFSKMFPFAFARIGQTDTTVSADGTVRSNSGEGISERIEIWKISIDLIRQNPLFGVGTGDVKKSFLEEYQKKDLQEILQRNLNAHNQYLQTAVAIGLAGFALLLLSVLIPGYSALRKGRYLYFMFLLIFAVNILVESMLETQAGVIFYAFFNTYLFSTGENQG